MNTIVTVIQDTIPCDVVIAGLDECYACVSVVQDRVPLNLIVIRVREVQPIPAVV